MKQDFSFLFFDEDPKFEIYLLLFFFFWVYQLAVCVVLRENIFSRRNVAMFI